MKISMKINKSLKDDIEATIEYLKAFNPAAREGRVKKSLEENLKKMMADEDITRIAIFGYLIIRDDMEGISVWVDPTIWKDKMDNPR